MSDARRQHLKATIITVLLLALPTACIAVDPPVSRVCECELLKEWVADLPILPGGNSIEEGITVGEYEDQFEVTASSPGINVDDQYKKTVIDAFQGQGLQHDIRTDTEDRWSVVFYPGSSSDRISPDTPWQFIISSTAGLSLHLIAKSDSAEYGIEDIDELVQTYEDDREAALAIQEQRQTDAIRLLEPIENAASSLAGRS